jgi:hypothetical protein
LWREPRDWAEIINPNSHKKIYDWDSRADNIWKHKSG